MNKIKLFFFGFVLVFALSCANRAQGPGGGPKDETPPRIVRSVPEKGAVNYKKNVVQVFFDENIQLDKVQDNVVVSPVQLTPPEIKGNGRLVSVSFLDDLKDSTTYSISFGDAIVDLNEKNALKNFNFAFSTGAVIDTLAFSGYLLQASNLEPMAKTLVGVHSNLSDTAIHTLAFERISKTNEHGYFQINNLKSGSYKVFALGDVNRDYVYQKGESVAFLDSLVVPYTKREFIPDTVWRDTVSIDTIRMIEKTVNYPQNLVLHYFKDLSKRQYLLKSERTEGLKLQLLFNAKQDSLPLFEPLNFSLENGMVIQSNLSKDTIVYWLKDTALSNIDTLSVKFDYQMSDSSGDLISKIDTIHFVNRRISKGANSRSAVQPTNFLEFKTNVIPSFDVNQKIVMDFAFPVDRFILDKIKLYHLVDSTRKMIEFKLSSMDSAQMKFILTQQWLNQNSYELIVDSAAFVDIYGKVNDKWSGPFKIKSMEEYSAIRITLAEPDSLGILEILDAKENVIQQAKVNSNGNLFEFLKPDSYYVRMFRDENGNGIWDGGDLLEKKQPEKVFYFSKKMTLKANWEQEENWDHLATPLLKQRPIDLRKDIKKLDTKTPNRQSR